MSSITQEELANRVGKSRSHVTNMLGLLKLPKSVQDMVLYNCIVNYKFWRFIK